MADDFRVHFDTSEFERRMGDLGKQLPYAISVAVNWTAANCVTVLQARLGDAFVVRNQWTAGSITFNPSTKTNLRAEVGSRQPYMALQAEGGTRRAAKGGFMAVPNPRPKGAIPMRGTLGQKALPPSKWPQPMMARKSNAGHDRGTVFMAPGKGNSAILYLRGNKRTRAGTIRGGRGQLSILYVLKRDAPIRARWNLLAIVQEVVAARWRDNSTAAISEAMATAKVR